MATNRIAIFAHFDRDNIIDDYVIFYLNELKKISQRVIFVSDCELPDEQILNLKEITQDIIAKKHGEYDFGSYKRGFLYAKQNNLLENIQELVFANDSCFGPFHSFYEIFDSMENKPCDFWGITQNINGMKFEDGEYEICSRPHLQSYFMVLKQNVFNSNTFFDFISSVERKTDKKDVIINYEIGLSEVLVSAGFKYDFYIKPNFKSFNYTIYKWKRIILECNMPFLKASLPRLENKDRTPVYGYENVIKKVSDYPVELIVRNVERVCTNKDYLWFIPGQVKPLVYRIINYAAKRYKKFCSKESA